MPMLDSPLDRCSAIFIGCIGPGQTLRSLGQAGFEVSYILEICYPGVLMYRASIMRGMMEAGPAVGFDKVRAIQDLIYANAERLSGMRLTTICLVGYVSRSARVHLVEDRYRHYTNTPIQA